MVSEIFTFLALLGAEKKKQLLGVVQKVEVKAFWQWTLVFKLKMYFLKLVNTVDGSYDYRGKSNLRKEII